MDAGGRARAERVAAVVDRAHRLLDRGKENAVQVTTGREARGEWHFVHARSGRPCLRCGTTVRVAMIGPAPRERTMFYCPHCQGGLGPTDDGAPQRRSARRVAVVRAGPTAPPLTRRQADRSSRRPRIPRPGASARVIVLPE